MKIRTKRIAWWLWTASIFLFLILKVPGYLLRKEYETAYWCALTLLFLVILGITEYQSRCWEKACKYWREEALRWKRLDEKVSGLKENEEITIKKVRLPGKPQIM